MRAPELKIPPPHFLLSPQKRGEERGEGSQGQQLLTPALSSLGEERETVSCTSGRGRAHRHHTTKSEVELANAGRLAGVVRRQQNASTALVERRAPDHAVFSVGVEPIAAPLPNISSHVMDSEPIGSVATHPGRKSDTIGIAVDLHWPVRIPTVPFAGIVSASCGWRIPGSPGINV